MSRTRQVALLVALLGTLCWSEKVRADTCVGCQQGGGVVYGDPYADPYAAATMVPQTRAYGRRWGNGYGTRDWERFYHYPYVYYPQNFWGSEYYKSAESLYYRYPSEMRIPVYNRKWHNYYPA